MEKKLTFEFWTEKTYGIKCADGEWYNRSKSCKLTDEGIKNILSGLNKGDQITLGLDKTGKFYDSIYVGEHVISESVGASVSPAELMVKKTNGRDSLIVKQNVLNRATEVILSEKNNEWSTNITMVETRGKGGQVVFYDNIIQGSIDSVPKITDEKRDELFEVCYSLNEVAEKETNTTKERIIPTCEPLFFMLYII